MPNALREVVLFREPRPGDPYRRAFSDAGFTTRFVSVLRFDVINADELARALSSPGRFSGLVVTSERAARCVVSSGVSALWKDRPVYSVGPRTAEVLADGGFVIDHPHAGTGTELARLIIARHEASLPLLFPCGTRRRDELPSLLKEAGIALQELAVYETRTEEVEGIQDHAAPTWAVFFSPSGVEAVGALVQRCWPRALRAAIGPTTAAALAEAGLPAHAVADTPDAASLLAAVTGFN